MTRYWTADSDLDWQDSVGMYEEPLPEAEPGPLDEFRERNEALDAFFKAVAEAIPETVEDWPLVREKVRDAGLRYCHTAVQGAIDRVLKVVAK